MKNRVKESIRNIIDGMLIFILFISTSVYALPSNGVLYDNSNSGSNATTVNEALDDLYTKVNDKQNEINRINGIGDASSSHILSGKTAYVKGQTITGSMTNYSGGPVWVNTDNGSFTTNGSYTFTDGSTTNEMVFFSSNRSGYFDQSTKFLFGKKSELSQYIKAGNTFLGIPGTYTSDATAAAGHILSGKTAYVNGSKITGSIPSKGAATYTPSTQNQTIAAGNYLSGAQTIKGDGNLVAGNIAKGKTIFGVAGTYTSDANAAAGHILSGRTAYVNGSKITGTIPSKGAATYTPGTTNQTIAAGNYLSGAQTIKGDGNLAAGNIRKGVSIFGVSGSYAPTGSNAGVHVTVTSSGSVCGDDWRLTSTLSAGTYIVTNVLYSTGGTGGNSDMNFGPAACGYGVCSGVSATRLSSNKTNYNVTATLLVTLSKSFGAGTAMGRMSTCEDGKYGTMYGKSIWVKIA